MSAHAKLSPSSASGWMTCADYVNANARYTDDTSEYAAEGTAAHAVSDFCLTYGLDAYDLIGIRQHVDGFDFEWTDEDAELLQPGLDWVREQPGDFYGEQRVSLEFLLGDGQFGTLDRGIISDSQACISDLKWGRGIPVSPVKNKQLQIYALGFMHRHADYIDDPAFPIIINVDQPRCPGGGGTWRTTLGDLWAFGEEARAAAERTRVDNPPRTASAAGCLWCKAKDDCATFDAFNLEMLGSEFDDLDDGVISLPDMEAMTPERRATIIQHRSMIEKWLDGLHARCLSDALAGLPSGGLKAVAGRKGPDKWLDKDAAEALLVPLIGDRSFTKKLITPTQVRKTVSPEDVKRLLPFIQVGERKPSLVPIEDERPAITLADEFDELD